MENENDIEDDLLQQQQQLQDEVYVYVKFLGEGSFGKVNLYRNTNDNSLVVWKEIDLKKLDDKMRNEAFAEVEILSMLDHPNIISYYKHFIGDDTLYIELQYAKAGTLAEQIKQKKYSNEFFDQETVLWFFYQLTSAIDYIHELGIMHRDLKTLNIFLMQSGLLKLGDFGLAKVLDPNIGLLETLCGTIFYMSPEIVEGKKYSNKSDIWALGCVIFEILTLKKVFDATNQLKLALQITECNINDIDSDFYTDNLKSLVKKILSKDPNMRPSARDILNDPLLSSKATEFNSKIESLNTLSKKSRNLNSNVSINDFPKMLNSINMQSPIIASKLSEIYVWGGGTRLPKQIEYFKKENAPLHVSLGQTHYAVITVQKELYTWNAPHGGSYSSNAKLGHGKNSGNTRIPKKIEALDGISIEKVSCGEEMTYCISEDGSLYRFGTNLNGCLGEEFIPDPENEDKMKLIELGENIYNPIKMNFFEKRNLKIVSVACGDTHVIVLTESNQVFTWGCGEFGRLGHGDEQDRSEPTELIFEFKYNFKSVFAGSDTSFLLTKGGRVLAFGNNEFNKLCLNESTIGFKNATIQKCVQDNSNIILQQLTPKLVQRLLPFNVNKICPGQNHTAIIDSFGRLFTFGSNNYGQLGVGDSKYRSGLNLVSGPLAGHFVTDAACGDSFTVCSTSENLVFSWGNKKDGRLGLDSMLEDKKSICMPKPIFGSLYLVSSINAKHWNSIIIAEKELNSKTVRSISKIDYLNKNESNQNSENLLENIKNESIDKNEELLYQNMAGSTSVNRNQEETFAKRVFNNNVINEITNESSVPDWLKKDFEEALNLNQPNVRNLNEIMNLEDAIKIINELKEENLKLKNQNKELIEKLSNLNSDQNQK